MGWLVLGQWSIALSLVLASSAAVQARSRPAQAEDPDASEKRIVAGLIRAQPFALELVGDTLGWVKRCTAEPNAVCTVSRGFSLEPTLLPTLKATITITAANGTHPTAILVPLDQDLRSGFAVRGGNGDAALGTYSRCGLLGCSGSVNLPLATYKEIVGAAHMDVIIKDINGRTVTYRTPLDGLGLAVDGPALSNEAFDRAVQEAADKLVRAAEVREAGTAAVPTTGAGDPKPAAGLDKPAATVVQPPSGSPPPPAPASPPAGQTRP